MALPDVKPITLVHKADTPVRREKKNSESKPSDFLIQNKFERGLLNELLIRHT